ncbi:hypothetical protein H0B56_12840 [Haloechinothrix sp. YIM 98757]|uniref:Uncharacterized protein n=1 Tax=Haloechinothrix aidingensis TaxID=2752311 RepID=A0A838AB12_9PSEU|nr:hypothetical protein [Haloechinothrix aidingensis]MBA0126429.1 hypothetical protein [Haloechinothrix aidingensis]
MAPLADGRRDPLDRLTSESPADVSAARRAWHHLRAHGLLSEHVEAVLAEGVVT